MLLGLVKNGPERRLHASDLPPVFDPEDAGWKIKGKVYGVVIPEGKSSGWIVPDAYRGRLELWNGDAKALLPGFWVCRCCVAASLSVATGFLWSCQR